MSTISLCMIVKDEEEVLERCLDSVFDLVDEIVIVDTGSKDNTKEIAKKYTDKVYSFQWINDFSAARNFSFSKASRDYVMWIDADDVIAEDDASAFKKLKEGLNNEPDVVMLKYKLSFDSENKCTFWNYRERLIKRSLGLKWCGAVHEAITPTGYVVYSDVGIEHRKIHFEKTDRNLKIYHSMIEKGITFSPRDTFYYARELFEHNMIDEAILEFKSFLESRKGWVEDEINACQLLSICYSMQGDNEQELLSLLKSFEYDGPRATICCALGSYYFERRFYKSSIFWYKSALQCTKSDAGFIVVDEYDYIPYISLCVCYDRIGDYEKAIYYNNMAEKVKPFDLSVKHNKEYFKSLKSINTN